MLLPAHPPTWHICPYNYVYTPTVEEAIATAKRVLEVLDGRKVTVWMDVEDSNSPCMIVFCAFEQLSTLIAAAKKHGFVNYIPLVFCKNYSPQVLKANMRIVGATEYALVLYRNKLPKFRNGLQIDEITH